MKVQIHLPQNLNKMKDYEQAQETLNPHSITSQVKDLVGAVKGGWVDPIEAVGAIKMFAKVLEDANKQIKQQVQEALLSYPNGFENSTLKVELRNGATRYKYDHIPQWVEAKEALKAIEEDAKDAAKQIQRGNLAVTADGEERQAAIVIPAGETIFITLKK